MNSFGAVLDVEIQILDPQGHLLATQVLSIDPARHRTLSLRDLLGPGHQVRQGSARVRYAGDDDMLMAWTVLTGPDGTIEIPFKNTTEDMERSMTTFWDVTTARDQGRATVEVVLTNGGDQPLGFRLETSTPGRGKHQVFAGLLLPGQQQTWTPKGAGQAARILTISHDGTPGTLATAGMLRSRGFVAALPVLKPERLESGPEHHAIRIPFTKELSGSLAGGWLTLANASALEQGASVDLVRSEDGVPLATQRLDLEPGEVASFPLADLVTSAGASLGDAARVIVRGQEPGLLVTGAAVDFTADAEQELQFFARSDAHGQGSYPIPDPEDFRIQTTLVNVSSEDTRIVGQLSWEEGTYAFGPLEIPARSARVLDFNRLAVQEEEDLDGRKVPRSFSQGFFHWTVQGGSRELVARTEVRPKGSAEAYGFNCTGCCFEMSYGALQPGSTTFSVGSSGPLEGVEFVDTCTGTMGPFTPVNPDWGFSAPLSWNGQSVTATGPDSQDLAMTATGHRTEIMLPCTEKTITIFGTGPATAVEVEVLDVSLPANHIQVQLEPPGQSGQLKVRLAGPSQKTLLNETRSSGLHTVSFGNLSNYTAGQEFDRVVAEWTVNGKTESGSKNYRFRALGSYNHTQYNTPVSNQNCSGSLVGFCYFTGDCINVQSCTSHQTAQAPSSWVTEVEENGSGKHAQVGYMSIEHFCNQPAGCSGAFRQVNSPCPSCQGHTLAPNQTVAVMNQHPHLSCGSNVYVDGVGELEVTDHGGGLAQMQLDHYIGDGGCNQAATIGQLATFLLL